mgnify:CR=1 FL=1
MAGRMSAESGVAGALSVPERDRTGFDRFTEWMEAKGRRPFEFQRRTWSHALHGREGMLLAPTGSGKTLALLGPTLIRALSGAHAGPPAQAHCPKTTPASPPRKGGNRPVPGGTRLIWITPLRALAKDLETNMRQAVEELGLGDRLRVERRTGDITASVRRRQNERMPEILLTTPESLHVLFASKGHARHFRALERVVVDEWHEFLGSKRGTQVELALARLASIRPEARLWGISATIGNVDEAAEVLFGSAERAGRAERVAPRLDKEIEIRSILPDRIEELPWSGHLGIHLLERALPLLKPPGSVLVFTNTRAQSEIWFRAVLEAMPELAGEIALHHGSLTRDVRGWVEDALRDGTIRVVVCTSSLDLGVDFSPVDRVIQVGSPKGIARFVQRAGRSGHAPGQVSRIHFLPTHALELLEAAALRSACRRGELERRTALHKPMDVLVQYMVTIAVSDGFRPEELLQEVRRTWAYGEVSDGEWERLLDFVRSGGAALRRYPNYAKVEVDEEGLHRVLDRRIARRHRMSIGTIASDAMLRVKVVGGGSLGSVEEWFVSRLEPGDTFWFAGRNLELVRVRQMTAWVRRAKGASKTIPSWLGGRMSLSSNLSDGLRRMLLEAGEQAERVEEAERGEGAERGTADPAGARRSETSPEPELEIHRPILRVQKLRSILPRPDQFLVEVSKSREGWHAFFFPFEGRSAHEGLSALIATRMAARQPISFTMAMNDYGFELLCDQPVEWNEPLIRDLLCVDGLQRDLMRSVNASELARRRFREIGRIAGLVFQGFPGQTRSDRHLQMSSSLFYDVFTQYEPDHLLLEQAVDEVLQLQLEEQRIRRVLERIRKQTLHVVPTKRFSPLAFPIFVDRLREKVSSESLADRIARAQAQAEADFGKSAGRGRAGGRGPNPNAGGSAGGLP